MAQVIGDILALGKKHSNLDFYYGPYTTLEEAYVKVPKGISGISEGVRGLGLTVGIYQFKEDNNGEYIFDTETNIFTNLTYPAYIKSLNNNQQKYSISSIKEYQWKKGLEDSDLKEKVEEYILEIDNISYTTDTINNTITFSIRVTGRGFGVLTNIYLGSNKIISESTVLNENQNIVIKAPENPGNYTYTISAVDSILGNGALTTHEVIWKEVDVKVINSSPIYSYKVKSLLNLQNSNFSFLIYKIDSVDINRISIIYGNNSTVLYNGDGEYNKLYTVNISLLVGLEAGNLILIKIEGNMSETFIKDVVLLTSPGIYSSCEGIIPSKVYNGLSFSATFRFEAENIGNYQVIIKDNDLDVVYNSSLLSYNTNTITLTLLDPTLSDINLSSLHTLYVYIGESLSYNYKFKTLLLLYVPNNEQIENIDTYTKFKDNLNFNLSENQNKTLLSYILDLICYIPYTDNNSVLFLFGNITITKDIILFRGITYPTPLLQNISLGFMCNVKSSYLNNDYYYDALFINGVLCYKVVSEGSPNYIITSNTEPIDTISNLIRLYYNEQNAILQSPESFVLERNYKSRNPGLEASNLPVFTITPISNILTKADLTENQISLIINNKVTIDGIEYDVIDTTSYRIGKFGNLGEEKYDTANLINDFCTAYSINNPGITASDETAVDNIINTISKAVKKNPSKIPNKYLTLTKLIVKSKKLLLKYVAVPCLWSYGNVNGYLLAFTLGTSTLLYALPNFTFKFFTDKTFSIKNNVSLIPKIERNLNNLLTYSNEITNETLYYEENELVAKADYMESSHLNNTPTAMFYNAIVSLPNGYSIEDKTILQNPVQNKLNAIEGIPIVLIINDINYGSFMLNIGKSGKSIGFGSNGISLEGTSNDGITGMSSRFDFADKDSNAKNYLESILDIDSVDTINNDFIRFINEGLEYRYSLASLDSIGDNEGTEQDPNYSEYLRILKMWHWVYSHETYTIQEFEEMFNFDFAALYYIQMMIFALTDNLGKNMMIDLFLENGLWYIRPYDMDSQAELDNNGFAIVSPIVEISSQFVLDLLTSNENTLLYVGETRSRFPFSSKTSNLWIRFFRNLRSKIEIFYKNLRDLGYSSEAVISLCEKEVINKLGISLYNKDFLNKYLSNTIPLQQFALGNRWIRFKDWITKRFDFCDTYFGYNKYEANTTGRGIDFRIKYSIPQYTLYEYNDALGTLITDWGIITKENFLKFDSTQKLNIYFSPKYIIDDDNIFLDGFTSISPRVKLNNLVDYNGTWNNLINVVDLSENTYLLTMTIKNINVISNNATIPKSLVRLTINDSTIIPELSNFTNLEDVIFSNCEGNISLTNCPNLKSITITGCKNINLNLQGCGNLNRYIDLSISSTNFNLIVFNGSYINYLGLSNLLFNLSFTGEKSYFKVVDLHGSTILNGELNISNLVTDTLILNSISTVKVITQEPKVYKYLGLNQSNISLFGNTLDTFDGSYISNLKDITTLDNNTIPRVKMIDSITDDVITKLNNNTYSSSDEFTLKNCGQIKYVINLNINSSVTNLFYRCINLISVENSNITASGYGMFDGCIRLLTLPTKELNQNIVSTIHIYNLDCSYMFCSCHALSYNQIEKVLDGNSVTKYWNSTNLTYQDSQIDGVSPTIACKATKYNYFLYNKGYTSNTTIDLSKYAFGTEMLYCFSIHNWGGLDTNNKNTTTDVEITYENKLPKTLTNATSIFSGDNNYKCVINDSNVFTECTVLTLMDRALSNHTFSKNDYFLVVPKLPNNQNLNLNRIFCNSRIDLTNLKDLNDDIFMPSNTISCASGFGLATLSEKLEISELFSKCTNLSNLTCCFNNCTNFTCENILNLSSNNLAVNVAGIFANNPTKTIPYGFDGLWYSDPERSNYVINTTTINDNNRYGPYYNTKIKINSESISISRIIGSTNYNMKNVFQNATIDNSENPLNIQLTIATKNCNKICQNLKVLDSSPDSLNKVKITLNILNSGIESANYAFLNVNILDDINVINLPNTLINCSYMFAGTNLVSIPHGLNECSRLQNISYMFYNCNKINDKIPTNVEYFLPISVTNIDHLFDRCYLLYGGIPNNFIQTISTTETIIDENEQELEITIITRNNLKSLVCTFASTSILLSDESFENNNNYGGLDIQTMFPKVTNVEGLFYYMCSSRSSLSYSQPIITTCFYNCTKCDDLFNSAKISIPNLCDFSSATSLRFAFACGYSGISGFAIVLGNKISDMTGMFAATSSINRNLNILNLNSNVNNVSTLLSMKKGIYTGMLYGYGDDMTKDEYKYVSPSRSIAISQHS